jgi:hypothetical protein
VTTQGLAVMKAINDLVFVLAITRRWSVGVWKLIETQNWLNKETNGTCIRKKVLLKAFK